MAANRHALAELPPKHLYLDTNFLVNCLLSTYPNHADASAFMIALAAYGMTTLYVSALSWMEFGHVVCKDDFRDALPQDFRDRFELDAWDDWIAP